MALDDRKLLLNLLVPVVLLPLQFSFLCSHSLEREGESSLSDPKTLNSMKIIIFILLCDHFRVGPTKPTYYVQLQPQPTNHCLPLCDLLTLLPSRFFLEASQVLWLLWIPPLQKKIYNTTIPHAQNMNLALSSHLISESPWEAYLSR